LQLHKSTVQIAQNQCCSGYRQLSSCSKWIAANREMRSSALQDDSSNALLVLDEANGVQHVLTQLARKCVEAFGVAELDHGYAAVLIYAHPDQSRTQLTRRALIE
jgi:hypothetical protein